MKIIFAALLIVALTVAASATGVTKAHAVWGPHNPPPCVSLQCVPTL